MSTNELSEETKLEMGLGRKGTTLPYRCRGLNMSLLQVFGVGPKYHIVCGKCLTAFSKRVPMVSFPGIPCPNCRVVNILPFVLDKGK